MNNVHITELYDFDMGEPLWVVPLVITITIIFYVGLGYLLGSIVIAILSLIFPCINDDDRSETNEETQSEDFTNEKVNWPYNIYREDTSKIPIDLGDRMKYYEELCLSQDYVPANYPFILRLDGRSFSSYTQQFKKMAEDYYDVPYSPEFKRAMIMTANDLLHEFGASTVYTHSDEISLVFFPVSLESKHLFDGRVNKLLSVVPSYASIRFVNYIENEMTLLNKAIESKQKKTQKIESKSCIVESDYNHEQILCNPKQHEKVPTFDGRLIMFPLDKTYEIVNHMMWRCKRDCIRNFVSMFAEKYIGKKAILNMNNDERVAKLVENGFLGFDPENENVDFSMKYGVFMKKTKRNNNCSQRNSENKKLSTRFYVFRTFKFSMEMQEFLTNGKDYESLTESDNFKSSAPIMYNDENWKQLFFDVPNYREPKVSKLSE